MELPLLRVLAAFLSRLPAIICVVFLFAVVGGYRALSSLHQADSSFVPSGAGASSIGALGGLAAQLGVSVGDESIFYYAELVRSRRLRQALAETVYRVAIEEGASPVEQTLVGFLEAEGDSPEERLYQTVRMLEDLVSAGTASEANVVTVTTRAPYPDLAVAMNVRAVELINEFNLRRKQQEAAAEKEFVEARLDSARIELLEVEEQLATFLQRNRSYQSAPELQFEAARLERAVSLRQGVYSQLAQGLEQARLETARNTPVITVLDSPEGSVRRSRGLISTVIVWAFGGFLVVATIVASQIFMAHQRAREPEAYADFVNSARGLLPRRSPRATTSK